MAAATDTEAIYLDAATAIAVRFAARLRSGCASTETRSTRNSAYRCAFTA